MCYSKVNSYPLLCFRMEIKRVAMDGNKPNPVLLSHCKHRRKPSQIPLLLNPIPIARRNKIKSHNPYLYREEDDDVDGAVLEEPQEFESWILRERERELVLVMELIYHGPFGRKKDREKSLGFFFLVIDFIIIFNLF